MGVLTCGRDGCTRVMCDRMLALRIGNDYYNHYICDDCFAELEALRGTWRGPMTVLEIHEAVQAFMESSKGTFTICGDADIEDEFQRIVSIRE